MPTPGTRYTMVIWQHRYGYVSDIVDRESTVYDANWNMDDAWDTVEQMRSQLACLRVRGASLVDIHIKPRSIQFTTNTP